MRQFRTLSALYGSAPVFFGGPGRLIRVAPDGMRTIITAALLRPTGVVVGPDGELYVFKQSISVGTGEVLRIQR